MHGTDRARAEASERAIWERRAGRPAISTPRFHGIPEAGPLSYQPGIKASNFPLFQQHVRVYNSREHTPCGYHGGS
jgi:hypothetical protein